MDIRPYLTFDGEASEAVALYERAFSTQCDKIMRFCDMPPNPAWQIPAAYLDRVVQATLPLGNTFIRISDCGPQQALNAPESERVSIAVETDVASVQAAFAVLAEEGRVGMPLESTFYSPCAGVVFDKFGVMWNFVGQ